MGWLTTADRDTVASFWPSVDEVDDATLALLLTSAQTQCAEYAPARATNDVPSSWRHAQALQARALWRSGVASSNDNMGGDGLTVTVFPMDWTVKRLLRPQKGSLWVK